MRRALKAIGATFAAGYASYTQYRAEFVLYMMAGTVPIVMMFAWMSLSQAGATGDVDRTWFAAYFLVVFATRQMSPMWLIRYMDEQVRLGHLSRYLLQPVPFYWRLIGLHLSDNAIRLPIVLVLVPLGLWAFDAFPVLHADRVPLYLLSLALGMLVHFHLELAFGLAAFWTDQSLALENFYNTAFYLLTGLTVPLAMFPETVGNAISYLPWRYIFGLPTEILVGDHQGAALFHLLAIQLLWVFVLAGIVWGLWRRGLRRYTAAGS